MLPTEKPTRKLYGISLCTTFFASFCESVIIFFFFKKRGGRGKKLQNFLQLCRLTSRTKSLSDHFYFLSFHIISTLIMTSHRATLLSVRGIHCIVSSWACLSLLHRDSHRNTHYCLLAVSHTELSWPSQSSLFVSPSFILRTLNTSNSAESLQQLLQWLKIRNIKRG